MNKNNSINNLNQDLTNEIISLIKNNNLELAQKKLKVCKVSFLCPM